MDTERSRRLYRRSAPVYDFFARAFADIRTAAIAALKPGHGETVLDLACGTGLSFDLLEAAVGEDGRIIGVDQSPEMLERARRRVEQRRWRNVDLVETDAARLSLPPCTLDAVLCCLAHDVACSREAMERAVSALKVGGRFVAGGVKLASGPLGPLANAVSRTFSRVAVTAPLTSTPWRTLEDALGNLDVTTLRWGTAYVASGARRLAVASLTVAAMVPGGCGGAARESGARTTIELASISQLPPEVQRAPVAVSEAYRFAVANPAILRQVPCYCGCGAMGHTSNAACYLAADSPEGAPVFDGHALGCSICVDITHDVMRLMRQGKALAEIRAYVDSTYARYGPSNLR